MNSIRIESPVGELVLSGTDEVLTGVLLPGAAVPAAAADLERAPRAVARAAEQLEQYFAGERTEFDVPLSTGGTPFQRAVWHALAEIPYGETISYAQLAASVGRPRACRAVGQANGRNPVPIVLPCHRVVASGGRLGGYGGGLQMKRALLALERAQEPALAAAGR